MKETDKLRNAVIDYGRSNTALTNAENVVKECTKQAADAKARLVKTLQATGGKQVIYKGKRFYLLTVSEAVAGDKQQLRSEDFDGVVL